MDRTGRLRVVRYASAPAAIALTLPLKLFVLDELLGTVPPYLLFFFPVILTAWWAGVGPGLLAVALNTAACAYYHHEPRHTLRVEDPAEALMLSVFVAEGFVVCGLMGRLRRARARAEESRRVQETFLAMVGHELRVPLNPILMEAAARRDDPGTPPALRASFDRIRRGAELEARLIDDLLDAVRIGRGSVSYRFERVDAHEVVRRGLEACLPELEARRQRASVELSARASLVRADPSRLQQVVWNLVRNASKFSPEGSTIVVRSQDEPCGTLAIEVTDPGIGLAPGEAESIFAPFARGGEVAGRFGGLGLGLAISRSIVEEHGGRLDASSPGRGRGATFTVRLTAFPRVEPAPTPASGPAPAMAPDDEPDPAGPAPGERPGRRHVLVVDDDEMTAGLIAELLGQDGYDTTVAHRLADALAVPLGEVDCVVTDLDLPDGSGADLLPHLRAVADVPVIVLSGYRPGYHLPADALDESGFAARLVKPVDYDALESAVREAIERAAAVAR